MSRFDDLLQRVFLLNAQLMPIERHLGSEARAVVDRQPRASLISSINGLPWGSTTPLSISQPETKTSQSTSFPHRGLSERRSTLVIDRSIRVERDTRTLATGKLNGSEISFSENSVPPVGHSTVAVLDRPELQRQKALLENQGFGAVAVAC